MNTLKGALAIFLGLIASAVLTLSTDAMLSSMGIVNMVDFQSNGMPLIIVVLLYRFTFNILGCYVAAYLAPKRPQLHAILLATAGLLLSVIGAAQMWYFAPEYYNIGLIILSLPAGLIGARIYQRKYIS